MLFNRHYVFLLFLVLKVSAITEKEDVGYANDFVDEILANFRNTSSLVEKIDPVQIPDFQEGSLEVWEGVITGLSSLYRHGDCILEYENKVIKVTAEVAVKNVHLQLRYKTKLLFATIKGKAEGLVEHLAVEGVVTVKDGKIKMEKFEVVNLGKYKLTKFTGMSKAFNWLVKLIANAVAKNSKKKITRALENGAAGAINDILSKIDIFSTDGHTKLSRYLRNISLIKHNYLRIRMH